MTREENLHWIDQEIRTWESECKSKHPIKEALHAARKALEQEPCEDAVSRKSVIAIIQNHWWNCRDIDKLVNELPPVTPQEPRWIPVTEKLPEDGQSVLFCDIDDDIMIGYHVKGRHATHFSQDGVYEDMKNVRAWQPLPEPYKGGE